MYTREARVTAVPRIPLDFACGNPSQLIQGRGHWLLFWEGKVGVEETYGFYLQDLECFTIFLKQRKTLNNQNLSNDDDPEGRVK